jgi:hypothetical protein
VHRPHREQSGQNIASACVAVGPQAEFFAPARSRGPLTRWGPRGNVKRCGVGGSIMSGRGLYFGPALAAMLAVLPAGTAAAANWLEMNFYLSGPRYDGVLPACDEPAALGKITSRFADKEHDFWNSSLTIAGFDQIRETAFRPWAANSIPRRFCSAIVHVSDGSKRPLHYSIGESAGMIGGTWGVEWCVVGLDRNRSYSPACKMAQP